MTGQKLLIGSLANDLFRVAQLIVRQSYPNAERFWQESQVWVNDLLSNQSLPETIKTIIKKRVQIKQFLPSDDFAEEALTDGVRLQNYFLHMAD